MIPTKGSFKYVQLISGWIHIRRRLRICVYHVLDIS